jgi:hypothetical protein
MKLRYNILNVRNYANGKEKKQIKQELATGRKKNCQNFVSDRK